MPWRAFVAKEKASAGKRLTVAPANTAVGAGGGLRV